MLITSERIKQKMTQHAVQDYPDECGGMLIGRFFDDGDKEIVEIYPLTNARCYSRQIASCCCQKTY